MRHAEEIGMNMNTTILCEISYQVEHGNPQWGMLIANEYMEADPLLRKALTQRFQSRLGKDVALTPLNKCLLEGRTKAELTPELSGKIGARYVPMERKVPSSNLSDRLYRRRTIENDRRTSTRPLRRAA